MKVIYLHGFNSTGDSSTVLNLKKILPDDQLVSLTYDYIDAEKAEKQIKDFIVKTLKDDSDIIIAGTSLGGFWANYFGQLFNIKLVMVNPAIAPSVSLLKYVGSLENFQTGEVKTFTREDAKRYAQFEIPPKPGIFRVVVLGVNDEVADYKVAENLYGKIGKVILTNEGHRIINYENLVKILKEADNTMYD